MSKTTRAALLAVLGLTLVSTASIARAASKEWKENHPTRTKDAKQRKRIRNRANNAAKNGKITGAQDAKIQRQENRIHRETRSMAAENGGHLTAADQAKIERQQGGVNRELKRDETQNAQGAPPAPTGQ